MIVKDSIHDLVCHSITYDGEFKKTLIVSVSKKNEFSIITPEGEKIKGKLGKLIETPDFSFTLSKNSLKPVKLKNYKLTLFPMHYVTDKLAKKILIEKEKKLPNILKISYEHRDRHLAAKVVNGLMQEHKNYVTSRNDLRTKHQLDYLEKRQNDTVVALEDLMDERAGRLSEGLSSNGLMELQQELNILARREEGLQKQLTDIKLLLCLLNSPQAMSHFAVMDPNSREKADILYQTRTLEQRRDSLILAQNGNAYKNLNTGDFQGFNLDETEILHNEYNKQLEEIKLHRCQCEFILPQIEDSNFEVSSLLTLLSDPASQKMIEQANETAQMLKDEAHRGIKEQNRLQEELAFKRKSIATHISQVIELDKLQESIFSEKIINTQNILLVLINRSISILEAHLQRLMNMYKEHLTEEQTLITLQLNGLREEVSLLPEKWLSEQKMDIFVNMSTKTVEAIAQLIASKNISRDLATIESGPINVAAPPTVPVAPKLLFFALLAALIAAAMLFFAFLLRELSKQELN